MYELKRSGRWVPACARTEHGVAPQDHTQTGVPTLAVVYINT